MTDIAFQTALSALSAAQSALAIVGNNVANASTPGYSRQRVGLESVAPFQASRRFQIGRGVEIGSVDRVADALLLERIRNQQSDVGRYEILSGHYRELESLFAEPGSTGLSTLTGGFLAEIASLTAAPEDPARRVGLIESGRALADGFNTLAQQLNSVGFGIRDSIQAEVLAINSLTEELGALNDALGAAGIGRSTPSELLDRQDQLLRELGHHLDVRAVREADGRVTVFSGGSALVSPRGFSRLEAYDVDPEAGIVGVRRQGGQRDLDPRSGRLRALMDLSADGVQDRAGALDTLARAWIVEANRVHTTGVPLGGGHKNLQSRNPFFDANGSGSVLDDRLDATNLPFPIENGRLLVNVTDTTTGIVVQNEIAISPGMTVGAFVDQLNGIDGLTASVDPLGQLRVTALGERRFDFSNRIPEIGDPGDTFGSQRATLTSTAEGPYTLGAGDTFTLSVDGGAAQPVTFNPAQFNDITQATAAEVAAAINSQIAGGIAEVVDGRLVVRSNGSGSASTLQLTDGAGAPLAALGLSTALETGSPVGGAVTFNGAYAGPEDLDLSFVPTGPGRIGVTPGLQINVFDASGGLVTVLDVGTDYQPGSELTITEGVTVSFGAAEVDPASGDRFSLRLVGDSDSSDVLVAMGLGGFFVGDSAANMGVDPTLLSNPDALAAALGGSAGDNRNLLAFGQIAERSSDTLDGSDPDAFYRMLVTELGADTARAENTLDTQSLLLDSLDARRESISGVNIDEELLSMERFQQLYTVAARFLQTVQEVNEILVNL